MSRRVWAVLQTFGAIIACVLGLALCVGVIIAMLRAGHIG